VIAAASNQFWDKYYVNLNTWVAEAERLSVSRYEYCGTLWQHRCLGRPTTGKDAAKIRNWEQQLAAMQQ
jgi:hypothetical protein